MLKYSIFPLLVKAKVINFVIAKLDNEIINY